VSKVQASLSDTHRDKSLGKEDTHKVNGEGSRDHAPEFPLFANLPTEIQMAIWRHAIPHPRNIPDSVLVFVNFDLGEPRAILPPPRYITELYKDIESQNDHPNPTSILMGDTQVWDLTLRDNVISLLHTCQNSRSATSEKFSLDSREPDEEWNTNLWDPKTHTLYLAGLAYRNIDWGHLFLRWLSDRRERPHVGLALAPRIALKLDHWFMTAIQLLPEDPDIDPHYFDDCEENWLGNLPALEKLDLFIDPMRFSEEKSFGQVVPYPPLDVPVRGLSQFQAHGAPTPLQIEQEVQHIFEGRLARSGLEAPLVEVSVLCWKASRSKW
jgi:2EXR family